MSRLGSLLGRRPHELKITEAVELVATFGALSPWVFNDDILKKAEDGHPSLSRQRMLRRQLPTGKGSCWVVYVSEKSSTLREAFVLPLQWTQDVPDEDMLPASLREIATHVRAEVGHESAGKWRLRIHPDYAPINSLASEVLSRLDVKSDSGWASLAAGLQAAIEGGNVDKTVWASCAWDKGIKAVESLGKKMRLAAEYGCRRFFVPESQLEEARLDCPDGMEIISLREGTAEFNKALRDYLKALRVPPTIERDGYDSCCHYYLNCSLVPDDLRDYYRRNVLPECIDRQQGIVSGKKEFCRPELLIGVVSKNPEAFLHIAGMLNPHRCLLLYTEETKKYVEEDQLPRWLKELVEGVIIDSILVDKKEALNPDYWRKMGWRLPADPKQLVWDMTAGPKDITIGLVLYAAPVGSHLVYLRHEIKNNRVDPGSEELVFLPAPGPSHSCFLSHQINSRR